MHSGDDFSGCPQPSGSGLNGNGTTRRGCVCGGVICFCVLRDRVEGICAGGGGWKGRQVHRGTWACHLTELPIVTCRGLDLVATQAVCRLHGLEGDLAALVWMGISPVPSLALRLGESWL